MDSRSNFPNSGIIEDDIVRMWCVVSFRVSLAGLGRMLADGASYSFNKVVNLFALAGLVPRMEVSIVDVIWLAPLQI